ncbi:unnamed protein product [Pelagomonas calceolata]|uniref:MYND-type domain-containing protein n=1 Tax=Pelagomonas calceolata TaxID=35677 RepID=A0A8J2SX24_9STRA|nr:unnamed protein product [Pelagomonas calceolata]
MILTQCAVCATELGLTLGKKCGRCSTRYCGAECQVQHWKEGGHDQLCKKLKKAGGAEQYNANTKYTEAVAVAAEKCAEDTKGQTCYICTQALHWKTKEGLVRGCSCRGTAGFAHVSCLAEQAKILLAEAEENNLGEKVLYERWRRWHRCSLCKQDYHGVVRCAIGWACWKTYVGRPEVDSFMARMSAMRCLGMGLSAGGHHADAVSVQEAEFSSLQRLGVPEDDILVSQGNLAIAYERNGRPEDCLRTWQDIYSRRLELFGEENELTLQTANNYAWGLCGLERFEEAKALLRKPMRVARRVLGENHEVTLTLKKVYAGSLCNDPDATLEDLREAVTTLEDTTRISRRVFGASHPSTTGHEESLQEAQALLRVREAKLEGDVNARVNALRDAVAVMKARRDA